MVLFVFPFAFFLIAGPLYTLILFASYVKFGIMLVIIILTILASSLVSKCLISRQSYFGKEEFSYKQRENAQTSHECKEITARQQTGILIITALTSWITPCIVWTNNFVAKSYFLVSSSTTSILAHTFWLSFVYIYMYTDQLDNNENVPITHCIKRPSYRVYLREHWLLRYNYLCESEKCFPNRRVCSVVV